MPRKSKTEISAVNVRIPSDHSRNYQNLIMDIKKLKSGVRVFGQSYVAITDFNPSTCIGVFSKYSEIDIDGDWFDVDDFGVASDQDVEQISIPENLKPNLSAFYFKLESDLHVVSFETYSESKSLSSKSIQKYFDEILKRPQIRKKYGAVEADIIKSYGEVERILSLPKLKELKLIINRPNSDDVSGDLAAEIEKRLKEQKAEQYEEGLKSKDKDGLSPNDRTKKLAIVAAENGQVSAKNIENGITVPHDTAEKPLKKLRSFNRDEENLRHVFIKLSGDIFEQIRERRENLRE